MDKKHRVCFPWVVVEVKHERVSPDEEKKCYLQAANAASTCLSMHEQLCKHSPVEPYEAHIPPVVALTFIGPEVKLWIAYTDRDGDETRSHVSDHFVAHRERL